MNGQTAEDGTTTSSSVIESKLNDLSNELENASCTTVGDAVAGWWFYPAKLCIAQPVLNAAKRVLPPITTALPATESVVTNTLEASATAVRYAYSVGSRAGLFQPSPGDSYSNPSSPTSTGGGDEVAAVGTHILRDLVRCALTVGLDAYTKLFRSPPPMEFRRWFQSLHVFVESWEARRHGFGGVPDDGGIGLLGPDAFVYLILRRPDGYQMEEKETNSDDDVDAVGDSNGGHVQTLYNSNQDENKTLFGEKQEDDDDDDDESNHFDEGKYFMDYAVAAYGISFMEAATSQHKQSIEAAQTPNDSEDIESNSPTDEELKTIIIDPLFSSSLRDQIDDALIVEKVITDGETIVDNEVKKLKKEECTDEPSDVNVDEIYRINTKVEKESRRRIINHLGIVDNDVNDDDYENVTKNTSQKYMEAIFAKPGDNIQHPQRHFIVVDHNIKAVVLSIRGSFSSVCGILNDLQMCIENFGVDKKHHVETNTTTNEAKKLWKFAGKKIIPLLSKHEEYELIITGHGLSAGIACVLTMMCYHNHQLLLLDENDNRYIKPRCFIYASSPVGTVLKGASAEWNSYFRNRINYLHEDNVVPFLSGWSVREFFHNTGDTSVGDDDDNEFSHATKNNWITEWRLFNEREEPKEELVNALESTAEQDVAFHGFWMSSSSASSSSVLSAPTSSNPQQQIQLSSFQLHVYMFLTLET